MVTEDGNRCQRLIDRQELGNAEWTAKMCNASHGWHLRESVGGRVAQTKCNASLSLTLSGMPRCCIPIVMKTDIRLNTTERKFWLVNFVHYVRHWKTVSSATIIGQILTSHTSQSRKGCNLTRYPTTRLSELVRSCSTCVLHEQWKLTSRLFNFWHKLLHAPESFKQ